MTYTNHQYMTNIFQFLQKNRGSTAGHSTFSMEAPITNVLIWEYVHVVVDKKQPFILGRIICQTWRFIKTRTSRRFESSFNITQKLIVEHSEEFLNVFSLESSTPHGRDQCCLMIKRSSGQKQKCESTQISFYVWGQMNEIKEAITRW